MSLKRGFDDKVYIVNGSARSELATVGDVTYGSSRTDIAVKTRASEKVRTLPGMLDMPISFTILAGTDPEDDNAVDGYSQLKTAYDAKTPVKLAFNDGTTDEVLDTFVILSFETSSPVDDAKSASVSVKPSALSSSGSGT